MADKERAERCEDCRFWGSLNKTLGQGLCHRFPPVIDGGSFKVDRQPTTDMNDWCGEFRPKDAKEAPRGRCLVCGKPIGNNRITGAKYCSTRCMKKDTVRKLKDD